MVNRLLKRIEPVLPVVFLLALFAQAYRTILSARMLAMMDMPAFPVDGMSSLFLRYFVSPWQAQGLGRAIDFDYREVLYAALAIVLHDNGELTQKVFYLSLLPIGSLSMYGLIRRLGVRSRAAGVFGAAVYGFNSITFGQFTGAPGQLATIALLPLLLLGMIEVAEQRGKTVRGTLLIAITFAAMTSFNPYFPLIALPLFLLFWIYSLIRPSATRRRNLAIVTGSFLLAGGLTFLLTLPSTLPTLTLLLSSSQETSVGAFTSDTLPSLVGQIKLCYNASTPLQLFRGTGNPCTLDSGLGYSDFAWWTQLGLILPFLSFGALFLSAPNRQRRGYVALFSVLALFVIALTWQIHLDSPLSLFKRYQFLFLLRNPVKITMFLPLAYAPLIAFLVDGVVGALRSRVARLELAVLAGVLLVGTCGLLIYNWPMLTGDMGLSRLFQSEYIVPPLYYKANAWMAQRRQQEGFFRTLWLPFDHNTQLRLSTDAAGVTAIDEESGTTDPADVGYVNFVLNALCKGETHNLGALVAPANVNYVVVDLTSKQTGDCRAAGLDPLGAPSAFLTRLSDQTDLYEVAHDQDWVVFRNEAVLPHIAVFDQAVLVPTLSSYPTMIGSAQAGVTRLSIFEDSPGLDLNGALLQSINPSDPGPGARLTYQVTQVSDSQYLVDLKADQPVYLSFGESYHPLWNAYYADGSRLVHFPAFYYANGYRVDRTGQLQIRLVYDGEAARNVQILISAATWMAVAIGLVVSSIRGSKHTLGGLELA